MLVLLVRHAQAAEQDAEAFPDDTERPLVPKGRRVQRQMSRSLVKKGLTPNRVYSSPWTRAWQTARILIRETGLPKEQRLRADTPRPRSRMPRLFRMTPSGRWCPRAAEYSGK